VVDPGRGCGPAGPAATPASPLIPGPGPPLPTPRPLARASASWPAETPPVQVVRTSGADHERQDWVSRSRQVDQAVARTVERAMLDVEMDNRGVVGAPVLVACAVSRVKNLYGVDGTVRRTRSSGDRNSRRDVDNPLHLRVVRALVSTGRADRSAVTEQLVDPPGASVANR